MIRRDKSYRTEERPAMRGGVGTVKIEHFWDAGRELRSSTRLCARLTLPPGASIGRHEHIGEEEVFILVRGEAEFDDDGEAVRLKAGDTMLTSGAAHSVRNTGSGPLELIAFILQFPVEA